MIKDHCVINNGLQNSFALHDFLKPFPEVYVWKQVDHSTPLHSEIPLPEGKSG